jgi:deoxyribonuclease-1
MLYFPHLGDFMNRFIVFFFVLGFSVIACGKPIVDKTELHIEVNRTHTHILSYAEARKYLFGQLHYNNGVVTDVYCGQDHKANEGVGAGRIPDPKFLNCEHTWPQSKFKGQPEQEAMTSDLHHLYPATSSSNSTRSNNPFGIISTSFNVCGKSKIGNFNGHTAFEPREEHKGNVARSMFYFSTRYNMPIDPAQEGVLRQWHKADVVDAFEMNRNSAIEKIQGNRNPFIDNPALVDTIKDF